MVQRYDTQGHIDCVEAKNGRYVSYEDYERLKDKYDRITNRFKDALDYQNSCKPEGMHSCIWQAYQGWKHDN